MDLSFITDFYEFSMAYTYYKENRFEEIVYFDMFIRTLPDKGGYLIFNGLNRLVESIKSFTFNDQQIDYLRQVGCDDEGFLDYLRTMKLQLDIYSVEDGTVVFANEPLITVRGPVIQAQIIETLLLLCINYPSLITTKAARIVQAAQGRTIMEFGARRAQGFDASVEGARCAVIAGCSSTSNTLSGYKYNIPISGTQAHSYIQLHDNEYDAFLSYSKIQPENTVLLVDTYDTLKSGVPNAIRVAQEYLIPNGYRLKGIRLDSGDLSYLSKKSRKMLDDAGLHDCMIIASNSLDEMIIDDLISQGAQIDSFGVGENLITARSTPVLGGVYKLVATEKNNTIIPKIKISENIEKITNPGYKKLYRFYDLETNKALADYIALSDEVIPQESITIFDPNMPWKQKTLTNYKIRELQKPIFINGECVYEVPSTLDSKQYCAKELATMWDEVKRLTFPHNYYVDLSANLYELKLSLLDKHKVK